MATNSAPIYGKQYIRYAETWEAAVNAEAGSPLATAAGTTIGIVEIGELRAVSYLVSAGANVAAAGTAVNLDGTTPTIRENINIGGRKLVLVSFA